MSSFSILWLPVWITNVHRDRLSAWCSLKVYRGSKWLEWWDIFKIVSYSERAKKIMAILDNQKLWKNDFKIVNRRIKILIKEITGEANLILEGFDEKIGKIREEKIRLWESYINSKWRINWIALIFEKNARFPRAFLVSNIKKWVSQKHLIRMVWIGFDAAFELAIEKLCEILWIELTAEIRETFMKTKEKYARNRTELDEMNDINKF